jgi:hypothetical protein
MFGDRFIKIVFDFEIKLFRDCSIAFGFQKSLGDC